MKRIVLLIDGTWDKEAETGNTNVAKLDNKAGTIAEALIKGKAPTGLRAGPGNLHGR